MSREFTGSDYLEHTTALITSSPLTAAVWFRKNATGSTQWLGCIADIAGTSNHWDWGVLNTNKFFAEAKQGVAALSSSTGSITAGKWHHGAAVYASSASRTAYLDGVAGTPETTTIEPVNNDNTCVGVLLRSSATGHWVGDIASTTLWNVALSAEEILALSKGADPRSIRPGNLVCHLALTGQSSGAEVDVISGASFAETGTVGSDESPLITVGWPIVATRDVTVAIPSHGLALGSAALRTTAGTQDLTLSGFGTPKGIIIWAGKATTSKTAVDGASWAYASANDTGEIQRAAFYAEHAADPTNSWRNLSYTSLTSSLVMLNNTGGAEVAVTVDSDDANAGPITDGWRVDVTTAPASGYQIIFLLIGGDSDIDVFDIAASNTDLSYGITPQAIYSITNGNIASNTSANDIIFGQGFSDGTNNAGTLMSDEDNEATTLINGRICSDAAVGQIWSGGLTWRSSLGSFQSSAPQGLVTTTGTPGTDHLNTTAFTLPTGWRAWVGVIDSPTSAASDWVVAPAGLAGITPQLVMISPGMMTATDTNDATNAAGTFGIALHDSVNARCLGCSAEDAAAAENVQTLYAAQWIYWADATGTVAFDINPSSNPFEVGGWTVAAADIATADSTTRKWPVLVLGTVSGGGVAHGMLLTGVGV